MKITEELLRGVYPKAPEDKIKTYALAFSKNFPSYELNTPRRVAAFLGQIGVESGELRYDEEQRNLWNTNDPKDQDQPTGNRYDGRKDLGNYVPNDGPRFIGRGIIQLTGRNNYTKMGLALQVDLTKFPDRAKEPDLSTKIALRYWKDKELNKLADLWNLEEITRRVNGNQKLHLKQRQQYSERALKLLEKPNA